MLQRLSGNLLHSRSASPIAQISESLLADEEGIEPSYVPRSQNQLAEVLAWAQNHWFHMCSTVHIMQRSNLFVAERVCMETKLTKMMNEMMAW